MWVAGWCTFALRPGPDLLRGGVYEGCASFCFPVLLNLNTNAICHFEVERLYENHFINFFILRVSPKNIENLI